MSTTQNPDSGKVKNKLVYHLDKARTVQRYIDEAPVWRDGTPTPHVPMTQMQWRIWLLASAGKFFEGMVVFMTGVALPLMAVDFQLSSLEKGYVGASTLMGILVGASLLGGLSDRFGRKKLFIAEMLLLVLFLSALVVSSSLTILLLCMFGVGLALGCDYPTAHLMLSESIPSKNRGKLVLSAFGFQAVGAIAGMSVGIAILSFDSSAYAWRWMYAIVIIPAVAVLIGRFFIPESPHWLMEEKRQDEAEAALSRLLKRTPAYPPTIHLKARKESETGTVASKGGFWDGYRLLFSAENRRATLLASVPWFLQDLATYGIGIFTPTVLASVFGYTRTDHHTVAAIIADDVMAAKGTAVLDLFLLLGVVAAVFLADRQGRMRLQIVGFIGCAAGLLISALAVSAQGDSQWLMLFSGLMLFNFMNSMGPNAQTYLIAGEVFPVEMRGKGAGFAASFAKAGAALTALIFPVVLAYLGLKALLLILVFTSLTGAAFTWYWRIETSGRDLETL